MRKGLLTMALALASWAAAATDDQTEIKALIAHSYDKPASKVETRPVIVIGDYAVASWRQEEHGGRALLFKKQGKWAVQLCSGKALRTVDGLVASRVPRAVAEEMSRKVVAAESALPAGEQTRFDRFADSPHSSH